MKHAIVFLYFLASSAFLFAEKVKLMPEVVELLQEAPKLAQNLRSFDTLCMEFTTERHVNGKWKLETSTQILVDFKKDLIRIKEVQEADKRNKRSYRERVSNYRTAKETTLCGDLDNEEDNIFFPKKLDEAILSKHRVSGNCLPGIGHFVGSGFFFLFDSFASPMRFRNLLEIIQDPAYQNSGDVTIKQLGSNTALIKISYRHFFIDLSKGMTFKYVDRYNDKNGVEREQETVEVTRFTFKDGRLFPTDIFCKEKDVPPYRQKVNMKSLRIDQLLSPSDFAVKIYPGTRVRDEIENKNYIAGQEMSSADFEELEAQLKNLADEVRKSETKAKNETQAKMKEEANREQQEKEKH
jgi:hypothetical protein